MWGDVYRQLTNSGLKVYSISVPLAASARHVGWHDLSGLQRVGQVFLADVLTLKEC